MAMSSTTTTTLIVPYSLASLLHVKPRCKLQTLLIFNPISAISKHKYRSCFLANQAVLGHFSNRQRSTSDSNTKMDLAVYSSVQPGGAPLPLPSSWKSWFLGTLITIMLPFLKHKWGPLFRMTKQVEAAVETAEYVTEVIEKVAEEVERVAGEVADELPEGGKLRGAIEFVENAANETVKVAHLAEDFINKIEEVEKEVESFMEPVNDQANGTTE